MAQSAFLSVSGQKQGKIRGPVTLHGRKDMIRVHEGYHEIMSPRDIVSGLPTGQRIHKPLTVFKEVDCASPLLMTTLVTNENLTEVVLQFWQQDRLGREVPYYTIRLTNANISDIRLIMSFDTVPSVAPHPAQEEVTFTYEKISWTWEAGGITAMDDWEARV